MSNSPQAADQIDIVLVLAPYFIDTTREPII